MSGSSRKDSGTAGSKARYQQLNLGHNFKGSSHDGKTSQKRGLQSLGKIPTTARRMPAPAQLKSLKSSNDDQDPSIALVPQGSSGWSKETEMAKEKEDPRNYTLKTEKPLTTNVPEGFKTNFPSLKEQEEMSKNEKEELERRQRDNDKESIEAPPTGSSRDHTHKSQKDGKEGHYHHGNRGGARSPYNVPPQQQHGMYPDRNDMYHTGYPSRHGRDYDSGTGGRHHPHGNMPHPRFQNQQYKHTGHSSYHLPPHNYPAPYIDPYSVPMSDNVGTVPSLAPSDEGGTHKDGNMLEDDEGWAGHQEEVDYTKEVVFEDSSDEDTPKNGSGNNHKEAKNEPHKDIGTGPRPQYIRKDERDDNHSRDNRPHPFPHPHAHPPYSQQYQNPYRYPPPTSGWYPPYPQQGVAQYRQEHRRNNREDGRGVWEDNTKRREELPKERSGRGDETLVTSRSTLDSVDSLDGSGSVSQSAGLLPTPPIDPSVRNYPKKIMIRDLGDNVTNQMSGNRRPGEGGNDSGDGDNRKPKAVWGGSNTSTNVSTQLDDNVDSTFEATTNTYKPEDCEQVKDPERGSVPSTKTLYEPEGRTSQEKFRKYQRSTSGGIVGGANEHHPPGKTRMPSTSSKSDSNRGSGLTTPTNRNENNSPVATTQHKEDKRSKDNRREKRPDYRDDERGPPKTSNRRGRGYYDDEGPAYSDRVSDNRRGSRKDDWEPNRGRGSKPPPHQKHRQNYEDEYIDYNPPYEAPPTNRQLKPRKHDNRGLEGERVGVARVHGNENVKHEDNSSKSSKSQKDHTHHEPHPSSKNTDTKSNKYKRDVETRHHSRSDMSDSRTSSAREHSRPHPQKERPYHDDDSRKRRNQVNSIPSESESRPNPVLPRPDSNHSRPDSIHSKQNPVPSHDTDSKSTPGSNKVSEKKTDSRSNRQNPVPTSQKPDHNHTYTDNKQQQAKSETRPRQDPIPSRQKPVQSDSSKQRQSSNKPQSNTEQKTKPKTQTKSSDNTLKDASTNSFEAAGTSRLPNERAKTSQHGRGSNGNEEEYFERLNGKRRRDYDDRGRGSRHYRGGGRSTRSVEYDTRDDSYSTRGRGSRTSRGDYEVWEDEYPSRTFDRSRKSGTVQKVRGGEREGRDSRERKPSERKDTGNKKWSEEKTVSPQIYPDLDDIESLSDWEDDVERPVMKKSLKEDDEVHVPYEKPRRGKKWDSTGRGRGQDRRRHGSKYGRKFEDSEQKKTQEVNRQLPIQTKKEGTVGVVVKGDTPPTDVPTKDYNFDKYDINAHNVYVVDRRSSHSDNDLPPTTGVPEEGFIEVKSKKDKQKDREEKRRVDGKKSDTHSHHKGSSSRFQDQTGHKGWGQTESKKLEQLPSNEEWPINEGRSVYGAVGDKPSREKDTNTNDAQTATNPNSNSGYKLFEKTTPFSFDPSISTTPRKGDRLQHAIELTLPSSPQITTSLNTADQQRIEDVVTPPTSKVHSEGDNKRRFAGTDNEPRPLQGEETERPRTRKFKNEQKIYTPPGARVDDKGSRGQRSQTRPSSNQRSKVPLNVDERKPKDGEKTHSHQSKAEDLQQHQAIGVTNTTTTTTGAKQLMVDSDHTVVPGNKTHPLSATRNGNSNQQSPPIIKRSSGAARLSLPQSSTKFGTVSYASALKMKGQVIAGKEGVVVVNSNTNTVTALLSPKLTPSDIRGEGTGLQLIHYGDSTVDDMSDVNIDGVIPLHDVLEGVLPDTEVDNRDTGRGYSPSPLKSDDGPTIYNITDTTTALSQSGQFPKTFSSPIGTTGTAQPPLYSTTPISAGGMESILSPSYKASHDPGGVASPSMKKLLQKDTMRPSSAQSLTDAPYLRFSKEQYQNPHIKGNESPPPGTSKSSGGPITRVSSAPSHLPLSIIALDKSSDGDDGNDSESEDNVSTSSKSLLNIAANEFIPNSQFTKKRSNPSNRDSLSRNSNSRGYPAGGQRGKGNMPHYKGHSHHSKGQYHQATPTQQPHPSQQQKPLMNKPPIDLLMHILMNLQQQQNFKNLNSQLPGGVSSTLPIPNVPLSTAQSLSHHALPLSYPSLSNSFPYQLVHPLPRKLSTQENIPATPMSLPHPPIPTPSVPTLQYLTAGSKEVSQDIGQVPNVGPPPVTHPSYFPATPLHPNPTQLPPSMLMQPHPLHISPVRPAHAPPINGNPQVSMPTRPILVEQQQGNSNSRPPLLPTPPGFKYVSAVTTPTVTTPPSLHHPSWSVHPQATIRFGLLPPSHDHAPPIMQYTHHPPSN